MPPIKENGETNATAVISTAVAVSLSPPPPPLKNHVQWDLHSGVIVYQLRIHLRRAVPLFGCRWRRRLCGTRREQSRFGCTFERCRWNDKPHHHYHHRHHYQDRDDDKFPRVGQQREHCMLVHICLAFQRWFVELGRGLLLRRTVGLTSLSSKT